ncbi:MAG: SDR family oxidoreductase [Limisphaerales bacterium]
MNLRVILITGANGFLGQAVARVFLAESGNNSVWLGVHSRRQRADELAAQNPGRCRSLLLDVTSRESWQQAVAQVLAADARLDVLVNNAGGHQDALLGMMPIGAWEKVRAANLDGVFHGCQAVLPAMIGQRAGRIVNIASLSALLPPAGQTNYAAAKAGVVALTRSLAKEVARLNVTVNAICPGFVETEALGALTAREREAARARVPMRRFGRPEEVAAAVRFLASAEASYITGSILKVDGGVL